MGDGWKRPNGTQQTSYLSTTDAIRRAISDIPQVIIRHSYAIRQKDSTYGDEFGDLYWSMERYESSYEVAT